MTKAWVIGNLLFDNCDRDLFFAIEIMIGDRHFVKRSQNDRDREIQWSPSQKRDLDPFSFFSATNLLQVKYFKNARASRMKFFFKKAFGCIKQPFFKLLWTSFSMKLMKNTLLTVSKMIAIAIGDRKATIAILIGDLIQMAIEIAIAIAILASGVMPWQWPILTHNSQSS